MAKPLIFISHSANRDPAATKTLAAIAKRLKDDGFEVLLDKDRLKGGDEWRRCLHTWLAHCHGGVVLLNKKALESPWVQKEVAILLWRAALRRASQGHPFPIVPVLVDVTPEKVRATDRLESLSEIEFVRKLPLAATVKQISALMKPLKATIADTPQRVVEQKLAAKLQAAGDAALGRLITRLREDLGGWHPDVDRAGLAAMLLLQAPSSELPDALTEVAGGSLPPSVLGEIIEILECFWVDPAAAATLTATTRAKAGARAALLNACDIGFTPKAYIARAGLKVPSWRSILVSTTAGEDLLGAITQQVGAELQRLSGRATPAAQRDYLIKRDIHEPLLVVLAPPADTEPQLSDAELTQLLAKFDYCTLVVMTGASHPPPTALPMARRVVPALAPEVEGEAFNIYRLCRDLTGAI
jgi:hypothetical protein